MSLLNRLTTIIAAVLAMLVIAGCVFTPTYFSAEDQKDQKQTVLYNYTTKLESQSLTLESQGVKVDLMPEIKSSLSSLIFEDAIVPTDAPENIEIVLSGSQAITVVPKAERQGSTVETSTMFNKLVVWNKDIGLSDYIATGLSGGSTTGLDLSVDFDNNGEPSTYLLEGFDVTEETVDTMRFLEFAFPNSLITSLYIDNEFIDSRSTGETWQQEFALTLPSGFEFSDNGKIVINSSIEDIRSNGEIDIRSTAEIPNLTGKVTYEGIQVDISVEYPEITIDVTIIKDSQFIVSADIKAPLIKITVVESNTNSTIVGELGFEFSAENVLN